MIAVGEAVKPADSLELGETVRGDGDAGEPVQLETARTEIDDICPKA